MKEKNKLDQPVYSPLRIWPTNMIGGIVTDPLGCYTGIIEDAHEIPVQDADDL